jgi:hypothetical protein
MTPTAWLTLIVIVLYICIGISKYIADDWTIAGMWVSYAIANIFLFAREFTL